MATISVTTDTYLDLLSYAAGDTIDISQNAKLTQRITNTVNPLIIQCLTKGEFVQAPTTPTTPMKLTLSSNSGRLRFEQNGVHRAQGGMIDIYTGDGTADQTIISGGLVGGVAIGYPTYVEVDDGVTQEPWLIIPTVYSGGTVYTKSQFGNQDLGKVLFWDHATGTLTCGDGTNGNVIPNGAVVRFPNIVINAATGNATYTSRAQYDTNPAGSVYLYGVNFTEKFYVTLANFFAASLKRVGCVARYVPSASSGALTHGDLDAEEALVVNIDPNATAIGFNLSNVTGRVKNEWIIGCSPNSQAVNIVTMPNSDNRRIDARTIARTTTSHYPIQLNSVENLDDSGFPKNIGIINAIGGYVNLTNLPETYIDEINHSDTCDGIPTTANAVNGVATTNCKNVIVRKTRKLSGGSPMRNYLYNFDAQSKKCIAFDIDYDASANGNGIAAITGEDCIVANGIYTPRSGVAIVVSASGSGTVKNIRGNVASASVVAITRGRYEHIVGTGMSASLPNYPDYGPFASLIDTGAAPTTGNLLAGPFGAESSRDLYDISGASIYADNAGGLYIGTTGENVVIKSSFPIRGITSFRNLAPTITGTAISGLTYEFRVANAGVGDWTTYAPLDGANLSSALATLSGYDSDNGFDMQIRVTASTTDATRFITTIKMPTNVDSAFSPEIAFTKVGVSGAVVGSRLAVFDSIGNLLSQKVIVAETDYVEVPYDFSGSFAQGTLRLRKAGYDPIELAVEWRASDVYVPVSQSELLDIGGEAIYGRGTGATDPLISFDAGDLRIDIGDGRAHGEDLFDLVAEYEASAVGVLYAPMLRFDGKDGLLRNNWKVRRAAAGDTNAGVDMNLTCEWDPTESPDDETNGSVDFWSRGVRVVTAISDYQAAAVYVREEMDANSVKLTKINNAVK